MKVVAHESHGLVQIRFLSDTQKQRHQKSLSGFENVALYLSLPYFFSSA